MKPITGHAAVNGISMYYEIHGAGGMPLVLIHGGGSTIETTFGTILPRLASHGKVIALELQAHGRTSDRNAPESFVQDADDVAALLKHLKVVKANIFGFSNGGSTTMQVAIRHPEMVNRIIVASAAFKRSGFIDGFFEMMPKATLKEMPMPLQEAYLKLSPANNDGLQTMFNKDKQRMVTFTDWPESDLKSISAPALVLGADRDVVTVEHMAEIARAIPDAQLMIFPGVHGTYLGEICSIKKGSKQPQITVEIVMEFLAGM
jgi:pimeloyl-ACP methyl ester carboxylesterase